MDSPIDKDFAFETFFLSGSMPEPDTLVGWIDPHTMQQYKVAYPLGRPHVVQCICMVEARTAKGRIGFLVAFRKRNVLTVVSLFVSPQYRLAGVATRLLSHLCENADPQTAYPCTVKLSFTELIGVRDPVRRLLANVSFSTPSLTQAIYDIDNRILQTLRWVRPCPSDGRWVIEPLQRYERFLSNPYLYCEAPNRWCALELQPWTFSGLYDASCSLALVGANHRVAGWIVAIAVEPGVQAIASLYVHPSVARSGAIGWLIDRCVEINLAKGIERATFMTNPRYRAMMRIADRHLAKAVWRRRQVFESTRVVSLNLI